MTMELRDSVSWQPGLMLREAREAQGMDLATVAGALLVPLATVEALEANRFESFAAPVYAKGYLRKYAEVLGLDPAVVLAAYAASSDHRPTEPTHVPLTPAVPPVRLRIARSVRWPSRRSFVVTAMLVLAVVAGNRYSGYLSSLAHSTRAVPASTTVANQTRESAESSIVLPVDGNDSSEASGVPRVSTAARVVGSTVTIRGLRTTFVQVLGADGTHLFDGQVRAGELHSAVGPGPWRIYLSDADGVELSLGAHIVDVPATRRTGVEARFGLEPDGTVR